MSLCHLALIRMLLPSSKSLAPPYRCPTSQQPEAAIAAGTLKGKARQNFRPVKREENMQYLQREAAQVRLLACFLLLCSLHISVPPGMPGHVTVLQRMQVLRIQESGSFAYFGKNPHVNTCYSLYLIRVIQIGESGVGIQ